MLVRLYVILSAVLAVAASPAAAPAQSSPSAATPLAAGTRVRVFTAVQRRDAITGVVVSHSADSLVVRSDADFSTVALASAQVARVDVSRGRHTQMRKSAAFGLLGGAAIGAVIGLTTFAGTSCDADAFCLIPGPEFGAAVGATLFGAGGALIGTLVGSHEREQWGPAPSGLAREARLGLTPARGGVALTASLRF